VAERWVINASPVILLAKAGVIDLLPKACDELVIPFSVVREVSTGKSSDAGRAWLGGNGSRYIVDSPDIPSQLKEADLGQGEAEVLAWAMAHVGFVAVLDDRQGRSWAKRLNVPLIGSLGAIVFLKERGLISSARPAIEKIRTAGGYVSEQAIMAALRAAGET
jgi:predicted nucleic acid-binding protein